MSASSTTFLGVCAVMLVTSAANNFLAAGSANTVHHMSVQDVQSSVLLAEIEATLGTGIARTRLQAIEAILRPMYAALPKNLHGKLGHTTVRYALHRVFVQRHGWSIKGLDPAGELKNSSSDMLADQVPSYIQNMFEQRLGGHGLDLHELAVFASTIEQLIHQEATGRLRSALQVHALAATDSMSTAQVDSVLDTYMMAYILGLNLSTISTRRAQKLEEKMPEIFLAWRDTQNFVRAIRENVSNSAWNSEGTQDELSFAQVVKVADIVGENFGKFQDIECRQLKEKLVSMEDRGSGRVRLSDFYKPALDGSWQFQESLGYLRQLGTMDESTGDEPRVMIANYLGAQANCIAASDYYSVCCINECEDLLGHLENEISAPEATPTRIAELVASLSSSSVDAPRTLSASLRARLDDIAATHDGYVQLHGRLFSQWLHHAYPRECPFPHVSGTAKQQSATEWSGISGMEATASEEELLQFTSVPNPMHVDQGTVDDVHDLMMWSHEEELLIVRPSSPQTSGKGAGSVATSTFLFASMASIAYGLVRMARAPQQSYTSADKLFV